MSSSICYYLDYLQLLQKKNVSNVEIRHISKDATRTKSTITILTRHPVDFLINSFIFKRTLTIVTLFFN